MPTDSLTLALGKVILDSIKGSGANYTEAVAALDVAKALLIDLDLRVKPTITVQS